MSAATLLVELLGNMEEWMTTTFAPEAPCPECGEESVVTARYGDTDTGYGMMAVDATEHVCTDCQHTWMD